MPHFNGVNGIAAKFINNQLPVANVVTAAFGEFPNNGAPAFFTISADGYFETIKGIIQSGFDTMQQVDGGLIIITTGEEEGLVPRESQIAIPVADIAAVTTFAQQRTVI